MQLAWIAGCRQEVTKKFEALERNHRGDWMMLEFAVMKKGEAVSWRQQQRICGWFREVGWMEGGEGRWSQALLRLYAFWQVQFEECVNDSYDVWSSFHYIPYSPHYILHIICRVWNWMEYLLLCLWSVWKHIIYWQSGHSYLYWETTSYFCSLWPSSGHLYSILK
jgi:hypothetical protein